MVASCSAKRRPLLISLHFVWILSAMLILLSCGKEERPRQVLRSIEWTRLGETSATQIRKISGQVKPVDQTLLSFAVGGTVEKVPVRLGDRVKKGDILAELDKQPFELEVRNGEAELKKAQASVIERRANYERINALYESNNASKAELDEGRASFDSAKSQVKGAEAQLGLARRDLRKTILRAPYSGVISVKKIEPFMEIARGKAIFGLDGEESGFEVAAAVPETQVIRLSVGDQADVLFPSLNNRTVRGVITEIGTRSQTASTYPVTVQLREEFPELRAGMPAEVAFRFTPRKETSEHVGQGLIIPYTALLFRSGNQRFVFIYDEKTSTVKRTPVRVIDVRENDAIIESDSLKPGDIIATTGTAFLSDEEKVNLMKE